jgi:hypothetical protein
MCTPSCVFCNKRPNVRINKLDYCNPCFEEQLMRKVLRHLRGFPYGSRILVYLDGTSASLAMAHILGKLRNKALHRFIVCSRELARYRSFIEGLGFGCSHCALHGNSTGVDPLPSAGRILSSHRKGMQCFNLSGIR